MMIILPGLLTINYTQAVFPDTVGVATKTIEGSVFQLRLPSSALIEHTRLSCWDTK